MTSTSPPAYPAEYYYPEFINSRPHDPILKPSKPPPLAESVTVVKNDEKSTNQTKKSKKKSLAVSVVTDQGLPDVDITTTAKNDFKKNLIRDPAGKNIPKLIVDKNIAKQSVRFPTSPITEIKTIPNGHTNKDLSKKPLAQPEKDHKKKEESVSDEPIEYDETTYVGPFSLTRKGAFIFYISMTIITLLAAFFLIMTGVFYADNYPDSSSNTAKLAGIGVCALVFYLGIQLILIGIWHQRYQYENPVKKKIDKKSSKHNDLTEHLKTSMEANELSSDYPYQQPMDYPPYVSNVNEQTLLEQPGAATGAGYYEPVVWPSNIHFQTQPNPEFSQAMEWSMETQQKKSPPNELQISKSHKIKKRKNIIKNPVVATEPIIDEFDSLPMDSNITEHEQPLPNLSKAPETAALIQSIAQMEPTKKKTPPNNDFFPQKYNQIRPVDTPLGVLSSNTSSHDTNHRHHHHHHRRHDSHHRHHSHHRHRHHHHRRRSYSPCSQCSDYSRDYHHKHTHNDHHYNHTYNDHHYHRHQPVILPRIVTPQFPKIIMPTKRTINTTAYREIAVNTGRETKIMCDSGVTADLGDLPGTPDNRLGQIPIVRRTVIVEPYPAQPSSQIIVKPQENMVGKIRLSRNATIHSDNEALVYPSTVYFPKKKPKKKKKSTIVNNNIIEDLHLEDIHDSDNNGFSPKMKTKRSSTRKTIKNAFYN